MTLDEIKAQILDICSREKTNKTALKKTISAKERRTARCVDELAQEGKIIHGPDGPGAGYVTPSAVALLTPKTIPVATVPKLGHWPKRKQPVVIPADTLIVDYGRPPERWETSLKPGQGAISQDWIARRQGADVPTRLGGAY